MLMDATHNSGRFQKLCKYYLTQLNCAQSDKAQLHPFLDCCSFIFVSFIVCSYLQFSSHWISATASQSPRNLCRPGVPTCALYSPAFAMGAPCATRLKMPVLLCPVLLCSSTTAGVIHGMLTSPASSVHSRERRRNSHCALPAEGDAGKSCQNVQLHRENSNVSS